MLVGVGPRLSKDWLIVFGNHPTLHDVGILWFWLLVDIWIYWLADIELGKDLVQQVHDLFLVLEDWLHLMLLLLGTSGACATSSPPTLHRTMHDLHWNTASLSCHVVGGNVTKAEFSIHVGWHRWHAQQGSIQNVLEDWSSIISNVSHNLFVEENGASVVVEVGDFTGVYDDFAPINCRNAGEI